MHSLPLGINWLQMGADDDPKDKHGRSLEGQSKPQQRIGCRMSVERIGKNFAYSLLVGVSNALFPIFTFPYVARVLGPHSLGQVNFATNLSSYFILASSFGLQVYGVREIAKAKRLGNLNSVFPPLFGLSLLASILLAALYLTVLVLDDRFDGCRGIFSVFALNIIGNAFLAEWFFAGVEEFRYIALRNAIIKLCTLPFLFLLVRDSSDGMTYVWIVTASSVAPAFWNFRRIRTHVAHRFSLVGWNNHFFLMARFLVISVICSFAASLPMTYIGYMWSDRDLGIFTMAYRVLMISLMVVGSLGSVLLPYLSGVRADDEAHFDRIVNQIFLALNLVAVPASLGIWLLSDRIALILGGNRFLEAGKLISYLSVIVLLSINSSFFVQQVMYPRGEEGRFLKITITVSIAAAIVDFFLVRHLGILGASIGLIFSESLILFLVGFYVFKKRLVVVEPAGLWKIVAATAAMGALVLFTQRHMPSGHQYTVLICIIGALMYTCALLMLREKTFYFVLTRIVNLARRSP